jgi:hypothetical protein
MFQRIKKFFKKSRAEKNERKYRKWLRSYTPSTTNSKIELVRVFTDRNDRNYYVAKDIGSITRERTQRIEEAMTAIDWGVPKSEVETKLNSIMDTVKSLPYSNMTPPKFRKFVEETVNEIGDVLFRMRKIKVDDLLIEAGLYFFYLDGENPYIIDPNIQAEKIANVKDDPELRAFFLNTIEQILIVSANGNDTRFTG